MHVRTRFLNDTEHKIAGAVVEALCSYGVVPVPWMKREERIPELAAWISAD